MRKTVEVREVIKQIDNFTLGPVNLSIEPGTITALVGDNGSGKSTLLKMIMSLVNPDKGDIHVMGETIRNESEAWKQHIAYQAQTPIGYDAFTGNDLQKLISRWFPHWNQKQFINIVQLFNIPLHKKFGNLSQGEQQKLTFALTLPRNTDILILDEPTSFMDIPSKKVLIDLLVDYMEKGERSILFASHQAEDIQKLADYIVLLRKGKMIKSIEKDVLVNTYRKFWLKELLTGSKIPGELNRNGNELVSDNPSETESYFREQNIQPIKSSNIDLEEIITLLLTHS